MRKVTTIKGVELLVPEKGEKHAGAGRPKGSKNKITLGLKEAFLVALETVGEDGKGKNGLTGYLIKGGEDAAGSDYADPWQADAAGGETSGQGREKTDLNRKRTGHATEVQDGRGHPRGVGRAYRADRSPDCDEVN